MDALVHAFVVIVGGLGIAFVWSMIEQGAKLKNKLNGNTAKRKIVNFKLNDAFWDKMASNPPKAYFTDNKSLAGKYSIVPKLKEPQKRMTYRITTKKLTN